MKLKAGALPYALFVGVVTAILCFLMLLLVQFNRQYFYRIDRQERVMDNCLSGVALGLTKQRNGRYWEDLFGEGNDSVRIKTAYWGLYHMVACEAKAGTFRAARSGLFGYTSQESESMALVLPENNSVLKLAGSALIKGDAQLSQRGLASAYIEGKNYSREKRIYGTVKQSVRRLPQVEPRLIEESRKRLKQIAVEGDSVISLSEMEKIGTRGFEKATLVCSEKGRLRLSGSLRGNMVVKSAREIVVGNDAQLEQVMLVAPVIRIAKGFKGSVHLLASDSIVLNEGAYLSYPSSAVMLHEAVEHEGQILIRNGARFNGLAFYQSRVDREKNQAAIKVEEGALIKGQLYANKYVEHRGKLEGTILAPGFILITSAGVYQHHLLDGELDRSKLASNFAGLPFTSWSAKAELISWL